MYINDFDSSMTVSKKCVKDSKSLRQFIIIFIQQNIFIYKKNRTSAPIHLKQIIM